MNNIDQTSFKTLSHTCFAAGFLSIIGSIATWAATKGGSGEERAHGERFGIFVGLWAPTFFAISARLDQMARDAEKKPVISDIKS